MPLCTDQTPNIGREAQERYRGTTVAGSMCGLKILTAMAPTMPAIVPNSNASQRLPLRNPRSRANCLCSVYSGKALRRRAEPEIDHGADQQQPGPSVDIDAEI